ncbi:hypothetical protein HY504_01835 [Candidatus Wolfebacteria bacterium]|nr:hypothetical protein [Candidatus Wolfebacteria bacterium]
MCSRYIQNIPPKPDTPTPGTNTDTAGSVRLDGENMDYRWATMEELKGLDFTDGIYEEIEMVDNLLAA